MHILLYKNDLQVLINRKSSMEIIKILLFYVIGLLFQDRSDH